MIGGGNPITTSEDLRRIKALPRRSGVLPPLPVLADNPACVLRPIQVQALQEILACKGAILPIRVGGGKTLVSLLAPVVLGHPRSVLFLPASLIDKTEADRRRLQLEGWHVSMATQIKSYQSLGRVAMHGWLEFFGPELIIADELHFLKHLKAAVTRRVKRYLTEHQECMFVGMSGTILEKNLAQFAHLLAWALGEGAPVPRRPDILREWGEALDPKVDDWKRRAPGAILELKPGAVTGAEAFQDRLRATTGIVFSGDDADYHGSLSIERITYKHTEVTDANFKKLRDDALTPDGWALTEAVDLWRVARQLAVGMHYTWWSHERYSQCLTKILKESESGTFVGALKKMPAISPTERAILSACVRTIENATDAAQALERLKNSNPPRELTTSKIGTESQSKNMTSLLRSMRGSVICADIEVTQGRGDDCTSTMITPQEKSEVCSALSATERLGIWETALRQSPEFCAILKEATSAAKPPDPWFIARKGWAKFVREVLKRSRTLDSELQVLHAVDAGELDDMGLLAAWRKEAPTFEIHVKDVWHDDTALQVATSWVQADKEPGIVWTEHSFFGKELAKRARVDYFGAKGLNARDERIDDESRAGYGRSCVASVRANATGRNLQAWSRALVTAPVPDPGLWEQLIGRQHRAGQMADSVSVEVFYACREHEAAFDKALEVALANFEMNGQSNKLLFADILPPPKKTMGAAWRQA